MTLENCMDLRETNYGTIMVSYPNDTFSQRLYLRVLLECIYLPKPPHGQDVAQDKFSSGG